MQRQATFPDQGQVVSQSPEQAAVTVTRVHYVDWLRVIAIGAVFLYHAVHPFDLTGWHIKNDELSMPLTVVLVFFSLWGMPFFFFIAGVGGAFALRRRTGRQYLSERFKRLLVPYFVGALLLMPIMLYFEWMHKTANGTWTMPFLEFVLDRSFGFSPRWFGGLGYHLWFLGFLFSFAVITLPLFLWLKGQLGGARGPKVLDWLARSVQPRGAILWFFLPLLLIQLIFRPLFPLEHDWADFAFRLAFFVLGFLMYTELRFAPVVTRDRWFIFGAALLALAAVLAVFALGDPFAWSETPGTPQFFVVWSLVTLNAWCWVLLILALGMRTLNFSSRTLTYAREAVLPVFVVHQPVIIVIAFFVVQWSLGVPLKMLVVVFGSLLVCLLLYEFVIRRINVLRLAFGMPRARG